MQPIPETIDTLRAQQRQLVIGDRRAQMFPGGGGELPLPDGFRRAKTPNGDVFHFDPKRIKLSEILKASKAGRENDILDLGPFTKQESVLRAQTGDPPVCIVERSPDGTELRASAATKSTAPAQIAVMDKAKSDDSTLSLEPPDQTVNMRMADGGSVDAFDPSEFLEFKTSGAPSTNRTAAAIEGILSGASANFRDEIYGASEASGLPGWLGGFRAPIGAARLGYEYLRGQPGEATERYQQGRDVARSAQKAAEEQFPGTYLTGQIGGALAAPIGVASAATTSARMAQGLKSGAIYGGLSGVGEGEGVEDAVKKGVTGTVLGGAIGLAAPAVIGGAGLALGSAKDLAGKVASPLRGASNVEGEASRRVSSALARDAKSGDVLTPAEIEAAQSAGQNLSVIDYGGNATRSLARAARNISPEAETALRNVIEPRFEGQGQRAKEFVESLVGTGANATRTREALEDAASKAREPFYRRAYRDGADGIWDNELRSMMETAPMLEVAAKDAVASIRNKMASGRAMSPLSPSGLPTLELWDQVKRTLDSKYNILKRQGDKEGMADIQAIRSRLIDKLDDATRDETGISSYQVARGVAAELFKASNALEAGEKFVTSKMKNEVAKRALAKMNPEERTLFADGYASALAAKISETPDRRSILNFIARSGPARERMEMALGPEKAKEFEVFMRIEDIMDRARSAVSGNSTTAAQLAAMGLAGGYSYGSGDYLPGAAVIGTILAKKTLNKIDQNVMQRVGELLASQDVKKVREGAQLIARNSRLLDALRKADVPLTKAGAQQSSNAAILIPPGTVPSRSEDAQP